MRTFVTVKHTDRSSSFIFNVKHGEQPIVMKFSCGTEVCAYFASQIWSFTGSREVDVVPLQCHIPSVRNFSLVAIREYCSGATTWHKLQRYSLHSSFIMQNWIYVILSHVHTSKGHFLSEPLSLDLDNYVMTKDMKVMISEIPKKNWIDWSLRQWRVHSYPSAWSAPSWLARVFTSFDVGWMREILSNNSFVKNKMSP